MKEGKFTVYYLFNNKDEVICKSTNLEELKQKIVNANLHTEYYGARLNTIEKLNEYLDSHEGVWFSVDNLLNENNEPNDMFIVEEFYAYQDEKWLEEIKRFNEERKDE